MADKDKPKAKDAKPKTAEPRPKAKMPAEWPPVVGLTVDETATALRTDDKTVRKLIQAGSIPARLVGRGYRIDPDALRAWVAGGQDGRKISPSADEISAEFAEAADADMADPEVQDALRAGFGGGK